MISTDPTVPRRLVVLGLISLAALTSAALSTAAPRAHVSGACPGTITFQLAGIRQTASHIQTRNVSCPAGKAVLRNFVQRANSRPACRNASLFQPPPSPGCVVSGYHCFLRKTVNYCATVTLREVSWRQQIASARCPIGHGQRPFFREITARGVTCATAQAAIRVWGSTPPFRPFQAAGRRWTWSRTFLRTTNLMRTRLHSGRAEVVFLSQPYS